MLDIVKGLLSGNSNTKLECTASAINWGRALSVEETLMLTSGIDLKTILYRKTNQVYIRKPLNIKVSKNTSIQSHKRLSDELNEFDEQSKTKALGKPDSGAQHLQRSENLNSEIFVNCEQMLPEGYPTNGRTLTFVDSQKKNTECIQWSSIGDSQEPASLVTLTVPSFCNKNHQPTVVDYRDWETTVSDTKARFFITVPKPIVELKISFKTTGVSGHRFSLPDYYQPLKLKGKSPNAIVIEAFDRRTAQMVAIKKYYGFMNHTCSAKRILRELKLWMWFDHQDVCRLLDVVPVLHKDIYTFEDIYIVIELMDADLGRVLRTRNLTKSHYQIIMYQLLRCLKYLHSGNVVHNNLKPENVLLEVQHTNTKITDFGYSQPSGIETASTAALTAYVEPLWYRSPEICLCSCQNGKPNDMWALGCIFAEMYRNGKPLFQGPLSFRKQLKMIFSKVKKPKSMDWVENSQAVTFMNLLPFKEPIPLKLQCPGICQDAVDLLSKLLEPDPRERITVERALEHPFVAPVRDRSTERECLPFEVGYEKCLRVKSIRGLRMMFYETIDDWRKHFR